MWCWNANNFSHGLPSVICSWIGLKGTQIRDTTREDKETRNDSACSHFLPASGDVIPPPWDLLPAQCEDLLDAQLCGTRYLKTPIPGNEMEIVLNLPCSKNIGNGIKQKKAQASRILMGSKDFSFSCRINTYPNAPLFSFCYLFRSLGRRWYWKLYFHVFGAIQHQSCWHQFYHSLVLALQFVITIRNALSLYAVTDWLKKNLPRVLSQADAFAQLAQKTRLKPTALPEGLCQVWLQRLTGRYIKQGGQWVTVVSCSQC